MKPTGYAGIGMCARCIYQLKNAVKEGLDRAVRDGEIKKTMMEAVEGTVTQFTKKNLPAMMEHEFPKAVDRGVQTVITRLTKYSE